MHVLNEITRMKLGEETVFLSILTFYTLKKLKKFVIISDNREKLKLPILIPLKLLNNQKNKS